MPVKLGIIGAGIMGERLLRAALDAPDLVQVSGVWDPSGAALDRVSPLGATRADSAAALLERAECVYVASPPGSHLGHARAALDAGRAVFLEKPLAVDVAEAREFVQQYQNARAAVNFPFASSPSVARMNTLRQDGALGSVRGLHIRVAFARWPRGWQQDAAAWLDRPEEGGFTREVVSHFLFLCLRLLGPPLSVLDSQVERGPSGTERRVQARLDAAGIPATLLGEVGTTEAEDENAWELRGVASVRLRDWSLVERQRPDDTWAPDPEALPNARLRPLVLRRQLEGVAAMTLGAPHQLATISEALQVQEVAEAMLAGRPGPEATRRV